LYNVIVTTTRWVRSVEFILEDSLGFILNKTNTKLKNVLFRRLREHDVTPEQWSALCCLWKQEGVTPKDLADLIFKDKPNTNRILEKLETKNMIVRKSHPSDKRAFQIYLTDRGRQLKDELVPIVSNLLEEVTVGLDQSQLEALKNMLNQMFEQIRD